MGQIIRLTEDWITLTTSATQPIYDALDVSNFDVLDLIVNAGFSNSTSASFAINLLSGMSLYSQTAWLPVPGSTFTFTSSRANSPIAIPTITYGFYRYIRWNVTMSGFTVANFLVEGIGRNLGGS